MTPTSYRILALVPSRTLAHPVPRPRPIAWSPWDPAAFRTMHRWHHSALLPPAARPRGRALGSAAICARSNWPRALEPTASVHSTATRAASRVPPSRMLPASRPPSLAAAHLLPPTAAHLPPPTAALPPRPQTSPPSLLPPTPPPAAASGDQAIKNGEIVRGSCCFWQA